MLNLRRIVPTAICSFCWLQLQEIRSAELEQKLTDALRNAGTMEDQVKQLRFELTLFQDHLHSNQSQPTIVPLNSQVELDEHVLFPNLHSLIRQKLRVALLNMNYPFNILLNQYRNLTLLYRLRGVLVYH